MDGTPQIMTAAELEMRAARVADPGTGKLVNGSPLDIGYLPCAVIDLKLKHTTACEIRDMIDSVRDNETSNVVPHMVPVLLEILRSGEPSFQRDSLEFSFRRVLLEILHRLL